MTAKTPAEIANDTYWTLSDSLLPDSPTGDDYRRVMRLAIEVDRAQPERDGTIHAAVIAALQDRADSDLDYAAPYERAIKWIERDPDGFWEKYADPMLDEIEADFTLDEEATA